MRKYKHLFNKKKQKYFDAINRLLLEIEKSNKQFMNQIISYIRPIISPLEQVVDLNDRHPRFQHLQKIFRMPANN